MLKLVMEFKFLFLVEPPCIPLWKRMANYSLLRHGISRKLLSSWPPLFFQYSGALLLSYAYSIGTVLKIETRIKTSFKSTTDNPRIYLTTWTTLAKIATLCWTLLCARTRMSKMVRNQVLDPSWNQIRLSSWKLGKRSTDVLLGDYPVFSERSFISKEYDVFFQFATCKFCFVSMGVNSVM